MEMKEFWTTLVTLMGAWAFFRSLLYTILPPELRVASLKLFHRLCNWCSAYCYFDIAEIDGVNTNELYSAAQLYLSTSAASATSTTSSRRLRLTRATNSSAITFGLANNDRLVDVFRDVPVLWEHVVTPRQTPTFSWRPLPEEKRSFTLRVNKKHKNLVLESYLDHIILKAKHIRRKNQDRYLYTNSRGVSLDSHARPWESVPFKHPSTFETLAMDPAKKQEIKADLNDFSHGQSFYQKTGRAWKRGYLLYGPPGSGKSSMIAAMANYLGYDIYDLELTEVSNNSDLRKLLMKTRSKSIIVIEDIDCSISLTNRKRNNATRPRPNPNPNENGQSGDDNGNSVTLSGLLNFTDGLWSCCGSERIFVFTTNHVEKLDPALVRSGRMDMHIFMGYCSFPALMILLKNYLGYEEGDLDEAVARELEKLIEQAEMTPADISEILIKNQRDKEKAVRGVLEALKARAERMRGNTKEEAAQEEEQEQELC